jgi:hypothetical protein
LCTGQARRCKVDADELCLWITLFERKQASTLTTAGIQNHRGLQADGLKPLQQRTLKLAGNKVVPRLPARAAFKLPTNGLGV